MCISGDKIDGDFWTRFDLPNPVAYIIATIDSEANPRPPRHMLNSTLKKLQQLVGQWVIMIMNSIAAQSFVVICLALGQGLEDFTAKRENIQRPDHFDDHFDDHYYPKLTQKKHSWPEVNAVEKIKFTKARGNYRAEAAVAAIQVASSAVPRAVASSDKNRFG